MAEIAELGFKIDSSQTVKAAKNLDTLTAAAGRTEAAAGRVGEAFSRQRDSLGRFTSGITATERAAQRFVDASGRMREANGRFVAGAGAAGKQMTATERSMAKMNAQIERGTALIGKFVAAFLTIQAARQVAQLADAYTNLTSKLRNVTESEADLVRVRAQVYDIAQRTRQEYSATGELYARLTRATQGLGLAESERLRITETINKAAVVSGATAIESANAIRQLSQGLASGALRGEEFNSVAEQMPILLDLVAKSTGKTRGELRAMAADGLITADVLVNAIAAGAADVDRQFGNMAVTIGGAMVNLQNALMNFVGGADQASESSRALAEMIQAIAQALDLIAPQVNELAASWRGQATEQQNVTTTAQDVAQAMKVVVTGLLLAKNAVDVLVDGFRFMIKIGVAAASELMDTFSDVGAAFEAMGKLKNPFTLREGIDELSGLMENAEQRVARFAETATAAAAEFGTSWETNTSDVDKAFAFLNSTTEKTALIAANTTAGVRTLGTTAAKTAEEVAKLAKTEKQMADLLGRLRGAINPVTKAWENYEKAKRDAKAIGASLIAQGKSEAQVARLVAEAIRLAADERDREVDAIMEKQAAVQALLADMEREVELAGMSSDERGRAVDMMNAEDDMLRAINAAREAGAKITDKQAREYTEAARALAAERSEAEKLESILSRFDDIGMSGLVRDMQLIDEAIKKAVESGEQFTNPEHFARLQAAATEYRKEGIDNNIAAMQAGIGSLQSMATEGTKAYKALEVASAALNLVLAINAVLNQGKGDPWTAFARMAAMAAAVSQLVGSIVSFSANGPSSSGAEARQAAQGRGTVLGDAEAQSESIANAVEITADATSELVGISRGMLNALQAMQAGIGAASGSLARTGFAGLDLAEGAGRSSLFDPLGIGGGTFASRAISAIFGGEQELIDQGLLIRGGAFGSVSRDPRASTYQTIEEEGGWFSSDEISDQMEALGEAATTQIRLILMSIGDTVREAATALGLDADEFNAAIEAFRVEEIRISTMDLTGEEAQEALTAVFSSIFDELAGAVVPWVEQFQRVGEGLGETLIRVATSVQVFQESILQLGLSVGDLEPERLAQVSVALVEAAGGIEQFIAGMQAFVANFAPESHRFAVAQDELTRALAQVGLTLPETRDGMWTLMQSLDATTESGQQQIATLLRLAGVADAYYGMLEDGADAVASAARAAAEAAAEAAEQDAVARALLIGITRERDYANMNTAARAIADVNARFSDLRVQLNATNPTLAEAAELERARMQAIEDANAALLAQADSLIEGLLFEESLVGLTDAQVEIANINREFDDYVLTLLDLGIAMDSTQMATLESIRAARIARVEMEELAEVVTVSFRQMRSSISVFIQDLRTQFEHLMDPGFMNWIEGLTGITRTADSPLVTRAGILEEVAQSYASGIASLSMQLAAAQAELDAMGSVVRGPERAALLGKIENLRQLLGDVSGALGDALDYVNELFEQQIGDLLRTLREEFGSEDEIGKINARFDRLIEQATAWGASMAQLAEIEEFRLIALMRASEDMYASQLDMIRHLQGYLNDMLLGEDSPLSATERVEEAWSQFQDAVATGNAEEATRLADVYLQLLRETQASGDDFNAQFWAVREILTAMRDAAVQSITDDATEQYLADIAAGGVLQLHALERLTAVMDSIRVATGGVLPAGDLSAGGGTGHSYATAAQEKESPAAMAAELALIREELAAVREAVNRGAERVAVSVDKTGERSDRANDQSRGRYAQPSGRSVR